ncbi:MAG: FAD-dependent oxidoreductase [Oscillospiraceae bacterium]
MKNENITVMLSTEATPELVSSLDPDAVIATLGSRPAVPTYLPGYDKANVMPAEYAYTHVNEVGNKVVVIGGGLVGAELALHLASCGKQVTIMHRHEHIVRRKRSARPGDKRADPHPQGRHRVQYQPCWDH